MKCSSYFCDITYGLISVSCWTALSHGLLEAGLGVQGGSVALDHAAPAEVVRQVCGGNAVERLHPLLEAAVVGVDRLNVESAAGALARCRPHRFVPDPGLLREGPVGPRTVGAEHGVSGDDRAQHAADMLDAEAAKDGIGRRAGAIADDEDRDLLARHPALGGLAAALAGRPLKPVPAAFEGLKEEGLVGFDDALERRRLHIRRDSQEAVPPAEGRRVVDAAALRGLPHAQAVLQRRAVIDPLLLLAQAGELGAGEPVEGLAARRAPEAPQSARVAPRLPSLGRAALRAVRRGRVLALDHGRHREPPVKADEYVVS